MPLDPVVNLEHSNVEKGLLPPESIAVTAEPARAVRPERQDVLPRLPTWRSRNYLKMEFPPYEEAPASPVPPTGTWAFYVPAGGPIFRPLVR